MGTIGLKGLEIALSPGPKITCEYEIHDAGTASMEEFGGTVRHVRFVKNLTDMRIPFELNIVRESTYAELLEEDKPKYISQSKADKLMADLKKEIIKSKNLVR